MVNTELKADHDKPFIQEIVIKHLVDEYPDLSYLEQEYKDCTPKENKKYQARDKARLDAFNNGDWYAMGIRAEADILVPLELLGYVGAKRNYQIVSVNSGGLWGIESDSDKQYIKDEEASQIEELKKLLKVLNVEVDTNVPIKESD